MIVDFLTVIEKALVIIIMVPNAWKVIVKLQRQQKKRWKQRRKKNHRTLWRARWFR